MMVNIIQKRRRICRATMNRIDVALRIFVLVGFVFLLVGVGCASGATIVVSQTSPACTSGDEYFTSIQAAMDRAVEGDEIVVCPGTYVENIEVNKSVNVQSYAGASNTVIEAKNIDDNIITITSNKVNISGFTIRNSGADRIYLQSVNNCNILGNNIYSAEDGILLILSNNNIIRSNPHSAL
jgi:parallel beta-helix repeat protein